MSRRGAALFAAMCVIWGIPYLLIKVAVRELSPPVLVFCRTGIAAAVLLPLAAARHALAPLKAHWRPLVAYTVVELAVPWVLLSKAEQRLPSALTGLLVAAVPLVGALLAWAVGHGQALDRRGLLGLFVGLAGVAALVGLDLSGGDAGAAAVVGVVVVGYAAGPLILARRLAGLPGLGVVAASLGLCAAAYAPLAVLDRPDAFPSGRIVASVVVLALVCTALAFIVFFELIAEIGPVRSTVITYVNPAVALLLGVAFLHEHIGAGTVVGFALILTGSVLATGAVRAAAPRSASEPEPVTVAEP